MAVSNLPGDSYAELKLDVRIERLDKAVAENERRITDLTRQAQVSLANAEHQKLVDILGAASKLQKHNERLFRIIDRTEAKLLEVERWAARRSSA
jgi:hypothetical protein